MPEVNSTDLSRLRPYGMGIAVQDKVRGSDTLEIYLSEQLPYVTGKLSDVKIEYDKDLPDSSDNVQNYKATSKFIIKAKWLPDGDNNRITPPDVKKNETVMVYKFADSPKYYWKCIFREPNIRRLETVTHMYSDIPDGLEAYDKKSSYWSEVSTHDRVWRIHTSCRNGEPHEYDGIIDTKDATVTIKDDIGNIIHIDTDRHLIRIINADNSTTEWTTTNINSRSDDNITSRTTTQYHQASNTYTIDSPTTYITGDLIVGGNASIGGNLTVGGDITCGGGGGGGSVSMSGSLRVGGSISCSGGNPNHHGH